MEKDKFLENIDNHLEDIREQFEIIREYEGKIPAIELDLILSNLRKVYEAFLQLEKMNQPAISFSVREKGEEDKKIGEGEKEEEENVILIRQKAEKELPANEGEEKSEKEKKEEPVEEQAEVPKEEPIEEHAEEPKIEPVEEPAARSEEKPVEKPVELPRAEMEEIIKEEKTEEPVEAEKAKEEPPKKPKSTLDLFGESSSTLADSLKSDSEKRVADKLKVEKIKDIKSAIGINEKFLFINELFDGSLSSYEEAIGRLNQAASGTEAGRLLDEFRERYKWEADNSTATSFTDLVNRKF